MTLKKLASLPLFTLYGNTGACGEITMLFCPCLACFTYRDVLNGHINYVQSRHQRMEPTTDQLMLHVSDGKQQSSSVPFYIIINPTNDEIPDFLARNITVSQRIILNNIAVLAEKGNMYN